MKNIYIVTGYDHGHKMIVNYAVFKTEQDAYKFTEEANQDICDYKSVLTRIEEQCNYQLELSVYNEWVKNHPFQQIKNDEHYLINYFDYQEIELS